MGRKMSMAEKMNVLTNKLGARALDEARSEEPEWYPESGPLLKKN